LIAIFVSKNGHFAPPAIIGCAIGTAGIFLLRILNIDTRASHWIGYEVLTSAGLGMAIQQAFTAIQTVLPLEEVLLGTAAAVASQSFGGSVFVSVGNTILQNPLLSANNAHMIPGVEIRVVMTAGATFFRSLVPPAPFQLCLSCAIQRCEKVFVAAIRMAGLGIFGYGMERCQGEEAS
jgi:hypothetical protein